MIGEFKSYPFLVLFMNSFHSYFTPLNFSTLERAFSIGLIEHENEWNEIVYNSKFSFEPTIGEIYHLYLKEDRTNFLSFIHQWLRYGRIA